MQRQSTDSQHDNALIHDFMSIDPKTHVLWSLDFFTVDRPTFSAIMTTASTVFLPLWRSADMRTSATPHFVWPLWILWPLTPDLKMTSRVTVVLGNLQTQYEIFAGFLFSRCETAQMDRRCSINNWLCTDDGERVAGSNRDIGCNKSS